MPDTTAFHSDLPFEPRTLVEPLRWRAENQPAGNAFTHLLDGRAKEFNLTYAELDERVRRVGGLLQAKGAKGKPVLLVYLPGADFLVGYLGCLYAGAIAVPTYPPDPNRIHRTLPRFQAIAADCGAEFALTTTRLAKVASALFRAAPDLAKLDWLTSDDAPAEMGDSWSEPVSDPESMAFLQYTSGSTGIPKGVMVSHRGMLLNFDLITERFGNTPGETTVTWLPNYHDMGLIDGLLRPLYVGCRCVMMSPLDFLKRPLNWLEAITKYRAATSGGPNFAYELCVRKVSEAEIDTLDLSSWRTAYNGAEPVRTDTIALFAEKFRRAGFKPWAMWPCYGLAEAVLFVSGTKERTEPVAMTVDRARMEAHRVRLLDDNDPLGQPLVSSGEPALADTRIVDPETFTECGPNEVGEVWVAGPSLASGYWNRPEENRETFQAFISDTNEGPFLRTGDLAFLREDNQLFITGRLKDLIIIRGKNHYPQDIEKTVEACHPAAFRPGSGAAFSVDVDGEERLVVVHEVQRRFGKPDPRYANLRAENPEVEAFAPELSAPPDRDEMIGAIRKAVAEKHGLNVHAVVLIKPGSILKTSSGKIQRSGTRGAFLRGGLEIVSEWRESDEAPVIKTEIQAPPPRPVATAEPGGLSEWLVQALAEKLKRDPAEIDPTVPFFDYGLDSKNAVELSGELEEFLGRTINPALLYDFPTVAKLTAHLAPEKTGKPDEPKPVSPDANQEPIAIVGIGCRFPGADSPTAFWKLLRDGVDATSEIPADRWDVESFFDQDPDAPGKAYTRRGGFLERVDLFDPGFFGITPREAERMDPQQRLFLEVAWEAFEDAGISPDTFRGSRTGVFVGVANSDFTRALFRDPNAIDPYYGTGTAYSITANRLSYLLDLHGPSLAMDTACSSSLVAVLQAVNSIRSGESEMAVAGGVNVILSPDITINFSKAGVMAKDGRCKTFDSRADGYARGEGAGAIILKPLSKAVADKDPIQALILGGAINNDGRSNGLMAPNGQAQEEVLKAAYERAGVAPGQVQYVEAHGTGTALGDPIEVRALGAVVGRKRAQGSECAVGSVKTNIGHLEAAAGIAGLIKVALALKHKELPPSINYIEPNPHIPFDELPVKVQTSLTAWPAPSGQGLAGISSFGFGGTNAHLILAEGPAISEAGSTPNRPILIPLSGRTEAALKDQVGRYPEFTEAEKQEIDPAQIGQTAALRRPAENHRLALVAESMEEIGASARAYLEDEAPAGVVQARPLPEPDRKVVFVYPGQGPQWWAMGRELMAAEPVFRRVMEKCDHLIRTLSGWSILEELSFDQGSTRIHETEITQPALFAIQTGLTELWRSYGIVPDAVVGHSMGEVAAVHAAGGLGLEDAARVIYHRGRVMAKVTGQGAMAAAELSLEEANRLLEAYPGRLGVAANNSPSSCVLSGEPEAIHQVAEKLQTEDIFCRVLKVNLAAHSPHMEDLQWELKDSVGRLTSLEPSSELFSTVLGGPAGETTFDGDYWAKNLRQPVLFSSAMGAIARTGRTVFLEMSPHPVLLGVIKQNYLGLGSEAHALPSMHRVEGERRTILTSFGKLWGLGFPVDFKKLYPVPKQAVNLPSAPFDRQRHWLETTGPEKFGSGREHPFLDNHTESPTEPGRHDWEIDLDAHRAGYIKDHQVLDLIVFPATGYLELIRAAAVESLGEPNPVLTEAAFHQTLVLTEAETSRVHTSLIPSGEGRYQARVESRVLGAPGESWTLHASATVVLDQKREEPEPSDPAGLLEPGEDYPAAEHYASFAERGIFYGPAFQGVRGVRRSLGETVGVVELPEELRADYARHLIHPALLDACLQLMEPALDPNAADAGETFLPVGIEELIRYRDLPTKVLTWVTVRNLEADEAQSYTADFDLMDETGQVCIRVKGLTVRRLDRADLMGDWFYEVTWMEAKKEAESDSTGQGYWVIWADEPNPMTNSLAGLLNNRGYDCVCLKPEEAASTLAGLMESREEPPAGLVYLPPLRENDLDPEEPVRLCQEALALIQALPWADAHFSSFFWVITHNGQRINDEEVSLSHSPLWGLGRSLAHEFPDNWGGLIDLSEPGSADLQAVVQELLEPDSEDQIALREGRRLVARLVRRPTPRPASGPVIDPSGTYLITGGLGALGMEVAGWLAAQGAARIVLLSRSGYPGPEEWPRLADSGDERAKRLLEWQAGGTIVLPLAGDVTEAEAMGRVMAEIASGGPPLKGIFHAAGVVSTIPGPELSPADLAEMMAPKVKGSLVLQKLSEGLELDHFVLFSSASAIWGSKLLAHYGAANHYLDGLARHRRARGLPALSINWAMWGGGGMSTEEENQAILARMGMAALEPDQALAAMARLMAEGRVQTTVAAVDWSILKEAFEQHPRRKLLAELKAGPAGSAGIGEPGEEDADEILIELAEASDESEQLLSLTEYLAEKISRVLGIESSALNREAGLTDQGMDSLTAAELKNRLEGALGIRINVLALLKAGSLAAIAEAVMKPLAGRLAESGTPDAREWSGSGPEDEVLEPEIDPAGAEPYAPKPPENILLTGATGFLGAYMMADLIRHTEARIHCLVRAGDDRAGLARLKEILESYQIWDDSFVERIVPVTGDLAEPRFGLDEGQWTGLAEEIDQIHHVGFLVNFLFSYTDLRPTNVLGTKEVLKLAATKRVKPVHFVSSFSVFITPEYTGREVRETDPLFPGEGAYRETKRASERLLEEARGRGLLISIYRPPFISWDLATGIGNVRDFMIQLIAGCLELGSAPDVDLLFHLAPVEFVSRAIVEISKDDQSLGGNFNVLGDETGTPWAELVSLMNSAGAGIELMEYGPWREELRKVGESSPLRSFFPALSDDLPDRGAAVVELFSQSFMPSLMSGEKTQKALGAGLHCPEVNPDFVRAFVAWMKGRTE